MTLASHDIIRLVANFFLYPMPKFRDIAEYNESDFHKSMTIVYLSFMNNEPEKAEILRSLAGIVDYTSVAVLIALNPDYKDVLVETYEEFVGEGEEFVLKKCKKVIKSLIAKKAVAKNQEGPKKIETLEDAGASPELQFFMEDRFAGKTDMFKAVISAKIAGTSEEEIFEMLCDEGQLAFLANGEVSSEESLKAKLNELMNGGVNEKYKAITSPWQRNALIKEIKYTLSELKLNAAELSLVKYPIFLGGFMTSVMGYITELEQYLIKLEDMVFES